MPLIQLWEANPQIVLQYNIKQIVTAAGDGILTDSSECSKELRHYLHNIPATKLFEHVDHCLTNSFEKSGQVLQDIVNELGRRLDYEVSDGLYQGRQNQIGYDGIWEAPDGHAIIIEIKTTDAYRINLDKIATYRSKLIASGKVTEKSSILIIVGRNDTGDLEAQIRGSRQAWDTRIISADALIKLVELKMKSDGDETTEKIRSLLIPFEYTRLDNIIDVMFTAAKDVEEGAQEADQIDAKDEPNASEDERKQEHTPRIILDQVRDAALAAFAKRESTPLIAHKRAQYWSGDKQARVVCPVSKRHGNGYYWYAYHPHQQKFLSEGQHGYLLLGCIDHNATYAIPLRVMTEILPRLNMTEREDRYYWHVHIQPSDIDGSYVLALKQGEKMDMTPYEIRLGDS